MTDPDTMDALDMDDGDRWEEEDSLVDVEWMTGEYRNRYRELWDVGEPDDYEF